MLMVLSLQNACQAQSCWRADLLAGGPSSARQLSTGAAHFVQHSSVRISCYALRDSMHASHWSWQGRLEVIPCMRSRSIKVTVFANRSSVISFAFALFASPFIIFRSFLLLVFARHSLASSTSNDNALGKTTSRWSPPCEFRRDSWIRVHNVECGGADPLYQCARLLPIRSKP